MLHADNSTVSKSISNVIILLFLIFPQNHSFNVTSVRSLCILNLSYLRANVPILLVIVS